MTSLVLLSVAGGHSGTVHRRTGPEWSDIALFVVATLFVTQTWLASLLAGGRESFSDDEMGNAFFTLVQAASSTGWMNGWPAGC